MELEHTVLRREGRHIATLAVATVVGPASILCVVDRGAFGCRLALKWAVICVCGQCCQKVKVVVVCWSYRVGDEFSVRDEPGSARQAVSHCLDTQTGVLVARGRVCDCVWSRL